MASDRNFSLEAPGCKGWGCAGMVQRWLKEMWVYVLSRSFGCLDGRGRIDV